MYGLRSTKGINYPALLVIIVLPTVLIAMILSINKEKQTFEHSIGEVQTQLLTESVRAEHFLYFLEKAGGYATGVGLKETGAVGWTSTPRCGEYGGTAVWNAVGESEMVSCAPAYEEFTSLAEAKMELAMEPYTAYLYREYFAPAPLYHFEFQEDRLLWLARAPLGLSLPDFRDTLYDVDPSFSIAVPDFSLHHKIIIDQLFTQQQFFPAIEQCEASGAELRACIEPTVRGFTSDIQEWSVDCDSKDPDPLDRFELICVTLEESVLQFALEFPVST